jgi:spore germination protein KB
MYGESLALMVFAGRTSQKVKVDSAMLIIILIAMVYMIQIHLRESLLLGSLAQYTSVPSLEAARMTGNSSVVSRTESIYSLIMLLCSLFRVLVTFFVSLSALKNVFGLKNYQSLVIPMAALLSAYSVFVMESPEDSFFFATTTTPFIWTVFTLVLPLITLCAAFIGRRRTTPAGKGETV